MNYKNMPIEDISKVNKLHKINYINDEVIFFLLLNDS